MGLTLIGLPSNLEFYKGPSFLIYINDLEENIKSSFKFYPEDTYDAVLIVSDPLISAEELNHDLNVVSIGLINGKCP